MSRERGKEMKKKMRIAAFLAATVLTLAPITAQADVGSPGKVYWNGAIESRGGGLQKLLLNGNTACNGSKWIYTCMGFSSFTNEMTLQYVSRQIKGVGINVTTSRTIQATADAVIVRDEDGNIITTISKTGAVENGKARLYSVLSSVFNGAFAATASGLFCTLNSCGGGSGGGVAYAISGSESLANALSGANVTVSGAPAAGCVTSACKTGD